MAINLRLSSSATGTRNVIVNMGGGPNLLQRSLFSSSAPTLPYSSWYTPGSGSPAVSTSDYYQLAGNYWTRPYDLDTMGSPGATVKAREGYRYVWLLWNDHVGVQNFADTNSLFAAYSNDPQVFPDPKTMKLLWPGGLTATVTEPGGATQTTFSPYQTPFLVYNPDSAGDKFNIYYEASASGRQHQLGLFTSSDLLSVTCIGPTIPTTTFGGTTSFGQPRRIGVNNWEVFSFGKPDGSTSFTLYKYTGTDGYNWTSTYSAVADGFGPYLTIAGTPSLVSGERGSNDYLSYWAVNSDKQRTSGATRISTAFASDLTEAAWQTVLQDVQAYEEDGVATIYITRGFPISDHDRTNPGPYLGNSPNFYNVTCSITSAVMDVTSIPAGVPPLAVGFKLTSFGRTYTIGSLGTGTGGLGTYNITPGSISNQAAGTTVQISTNGGLWNQFSDIYYLHTDATAAASAAPMGVVADCTGGIVTISWNNSLPHQNYRVYRGTTSGTQATLIGDVTGLSITDTPTPGSQYWYKVVTMNSGEQKSRVVTSMPATTARWSTGTSAA